MYLITANSAEGEQLPTFMLDEKIQGITNCNHAVRIARELVGGDAYINAMYVETEVLVNAPANR